MMVLLPGGPCHRRITRRLDGRGAEALSALPGAFEPLRHANDLTGERERDNQVATVGVTPLAPTNLVGPGLPVRQVTTSA